jgi:antitoxin component HigA of HigAB toxin-antitoxin module
MRLALVKPIVNDYSEVMLNPIERLRSYLESQELTQAAFAEKMGVSEAYVSLVLNGKRAPNADMLKVLGLRVRKQLIYERARAE